MSNNNAGWVARELRLLGYDNYNYISDCEIELALHELYLLDINLFSDLLKKYQWNNGNNNWTNDKKIMSKIINIINPHNIDNYTNSNMWDMFVIYFLQHLNFKYYYESKNN